MTIRPDVVDALNGWRTAAGDESGMNMIDLAHGATPEERAAAAMTRLVAQMQAAGAIKAKLTDVLTGSGLTGDEAADITNQVTLNLTAMPHSLAVKIAGDVPGIAGLEGIRASYGDAWAEAVAGEARLPVHEVRAIYGEVAPS
jgi:hypothetical protein